MNTLFIEPFNAADSFIIIVLPYSDDETVCSIKHNTTSCCPLPVRLLGLDLMRHNILRVTERDLLHWP